MHITTMRKVGASVMLAVPPALLEVLGLAPGSRVGLAVQSGRLVVEPRLRQRYSLEELLSQCDPKARRGKEERQWLARKAAGNELI